MEQAAAIQAAATVAARGAGRVRIRRVELGLATMER
jgi:hypothetical protein